MAIQANGSVILKTPSGWGDLSCPEWTLAFFLRFDAMTGTSGRQFVFNSNTPYYMWIPNTSDPSVYSMIASQPDATHEWDEIGVAGNPIGVPVLVVFSYSSSDPSKCSLTINGVKHRITAWDSYAGNIDLSKPWTIFGGQDGTAAHQTIEHLLLISKVLSDAEVAALQYDPAGTIPTLSATTKLYYPFTGTVGDDVATGDAGISISGDVTRGWEVDASGGGTLKYATPFVYSRQTHVGQLYVGSSGTSITLAVTEIDGGKPVVFTSGGVSAMTPPVFKVNGVALTGLPAPIARPNLGGFIWLLPSGTTILPGDVVTADAPDDWISSSLGGCVGLTAATVANRVGTPSAEPSDGLMRVGVNTKALMASYLSSGYIQSNLIKVAEHWNDRWEDGTPKAPFNIAVPGHIANYGGDAFGYSPEAFIGKWLLAWDDYDHANPFTDMALVEFGAPFSVTEVPGYAGVSNPTTGEGRTRVYDVQKETWNFTLDADVDASTTTILASGVTSPKWTGNPAPGFIYLKIDDEEIRIGDYAGGFIDCTRGYRGTTAASHTAGATVTVNWTSNNVGAIIKSSHAAGENRRFKNLRVYLPGEWDEPGSVEAVTVGPEDHYALNRFFKSNIVDHGLGVIRSMETFDAMNDGVTEIEDATSPEDAFWVYSKVKMKWSFAGAKKFTPTGRYFYFNEEFPGTETYSATLTEAIDAATTSVKITTVDGERIPFGQTLFIGTERIRIRDPLPATASDPYTVVRGRMGTTAASHTAGAAVTVGWRKPVTLSSQYEMVDPSSGRGYHYCEIVLDEANSTRPIYNGLFMDWGRGDVSNDVNIQARRSFTLAAAFSSTALTMTVTPTSPGDWDWIQAGGYVHLNGETMRVASVDSGAGTITVLADSRTGSAGDLTIGAAGTHTSGGVLYGSGDGTVKCYQDVMNYYARSLITTSANSAILYTESDERFAAKADHFAAVADQDFAVDSLVKPPQAQVPATYAPSNHYPAAFHARLCKTAKADAWVNTPYPASDDMIWEVVETYLNELPPGRKLYISPGNELWNFGIAGGSLAQSYSHALGVGGSVFDQYVLKVLHVGKVAKQCAAAMGREADVYATGEWQQGGMGLFASRLQALQTAGWPVETSLDRVADAPYFHPTEGDEFLAICEAIDDDAQLIDLYQFDFEFSDNYRVVADSAIAGRDALRTHFGWETEHCNYEGDLEMFSPNATGGFDEADTQRWYLRAKDCVYNPNFRHFQRSWWEILRRVHGSVAMATFCYASPSDHINNLWGVFWYHGQKVGRGDGTDGLTDNRQYLYTQGKPNSVDPLKDSPARHNVNNRALALSEYNDEFFGNEPTPIPIAVVSAATPPSGATVTIAFDRPIVLNAGPAAFAVTVDGAARAVASAAASGASVVLTLASPIFTSQTVTVAAAADGVKDADGLPSNAFSIAVANGSLIPNPGNGGHPGNPHHGKPRRWPFGGSNARAARGYR